MVKRVRRGGSSKADGCLITRLAIWAAVTEPLNPVRYSEGVCEQRACAISHSDARIYKDANGNIAREANMGAKRAHSRVAYVIRHIPVRPL